MQKTKTREGAIFIETDVGGRKVIGYRAVREGQLGIAYVKEEEVLGFKPMADFIEDFYTGVFLELVEGKAGKAQVGADLQKRMK